MGENIVINFHYPPKITSLFIVKKDNACRKHGETFENSVPCGPGHRLKITGLYQICDLKVSPFCLSELRKKFDSGIGKLFIRSIMSIEK